MFKYFAAAAFFSDFKIQPCTSCLRLCTADMSQSALTPSEMIALKELLTKARGSDLMKDLFADEIRNGMLGNPAESSWEEVTNGAMSDASKRHLSPEPGVPAKSGKSAVSLRSLPLIPAHWEQLEKIGEPHLPHQISSVLQWSQTIITFGKFKSVEMSYMDLVLSKDTNHSGYIKWIREHKSESSSAQLKDLSRFIEVFNEVIPLTSSSEIRFPGSSIARQFKVQ